MSGVQRILVEDAITALLLAIGENPHREGLTDTPARVSKFWYEFLDGEQGQLDRHFAGESYDEMVILRGVRFYSLCEHHLLPFFGTAAVAYIPNGTLLGLSKLARIVRKHAGRLQVQERLTHGIAAEVQALSKGRGVGVSVEGQHLCAAMRGVRSQDSVFVTNVVLGAMREDAAARAEFLDAVKRT